MCYVLTHIAFEQGFNLITPTSLSFRDTNLSKKKEPLIVFRKHHVDLIVH